MKRRKNVRNTEYGCRVNAMKKKTKQITMIAMLTALYFVLSAMLKIPIAGHITLDLGYIALMVGAVYFGPVPAMMIGGIGAFLESALMSQRGVSIGWIVMNVIIGAAVGWAMQKYADKGKKPLVIAALISVTVSALFGAAAKMFLDCAIYDLPILLKIPTTAAAWLSDSFVMLAAGLPLSMALRSRFRIR